MNNKTIKLIVALVIAVSVVCTCAFAATYSIQFFKYPAGTENNTVKATVNNKNGAGSSDLGANGEIIYIAGDPDTATTNATGRTFLGWFDLNGVELVKGNILPQTGINNFYPRYEQGAVKYTITLKVGDTVFKTISAEENANIADAIAAANVGTPSKSTTAQYTFAFANWDVADDATLTGDVEIQAVFTETLRKYTLYFQYEDGRSYASESYNYGEVILEHSWLPTGAETKASDENYDYEFDGWYNVSTNEKVTAETIVTGTATYSAKFNAIAKAPVIPDSVPTTIEKGGKVYTNVPNARLTKDLPAVFAGNVVVDYYTDGRTGTKSFGFTVENAPANITGEGATVTFDVAIIGVPEEVIISRIDVVFGE